MAATVQFKHDTSLRSKHSLRRLSTFAAMLLFVLINLMPSTYFNWIPIVDCQDIEDLTKQQTASGNLQLPQNTFQQTNRQLHQHTFPSPTSSGGSVSQLQQQQQSNSASVAQQSFTNSATVRQSNQRPSLTNRFSSANNNQLTPQASSSPLLSSQAAQLGSSSNNVEQLMKNAIARTSRLEISNPSPDQELGQASSFASRGELNGNVQTKPLPALQAAAAMASESNINIRQTSGGPSSNATDRAMAEVATINSANDESDSSTNLPSASGHETVYTDQRFANLFARRNNNNSKKPKFIPTEQIKAKPTLPSFIKSPVKVPTAPIDLNQDRPIQSATTSNVVSAKLQQSSSNRVGGPIQPKKSGPSFTSTSPIGATKPRQNSSNVKQSTSTVAPKSNQKSSSSKPTTPNNNNPFNRSSGNNSDPVNVIAAARKRLLANNAIESGKLLRQQQLQQQQKLAN